MTIFFTTHYLDEAEDVAEQIAIIDHGKIITRGTVAELTKETGTKTLEDAYLKLTGTMTRDDSDAGDNDGLNFRMALRNRTLR
jgi:ABC-2 type transport system ATP-binding protein